MNLRCIALISSIGLLLLQISARGQAIDTLAFAKHLKQSHLFREHIAFNKKLLDVHGVNTTVKDSLRLELAFTYHQLHLSDSSKKAISSVSAGNHFSDSLNRLYITLLILNKEYNTAKAKLGTIQTKTTQRTFQVDSELAIKMLDRSLNKSDTTYNSNTVSSSMLDIKSRYLNYPNYSPAAAGIYSAVVPGLGKWYIGYKNQAITSFASNALLAGQAIESYLKSGVKSPRFIITAGLFGIFYTGNIIGSITMTKKKKRDYFNQIDYELLDYYSSDINTVYR